MTNPKQSIFVGRWKELKKEHPDSIVFIRWGDFYETLFDDAKTVAKAMGMTLTSKTREDIPACGFIYFALEGYLRKLAEKGIKVSIFDNLG